MSDVLSQNEIDQLLTAISTSDVPANEEEGISDQRKIKIYDFKRPDKFSKDQIRTVSIMHETFARLTTTSLSAQLRTLINVRVASVDQLTYEEFIRSIPNPTTLAVIDMDPLNGSAILEIDPAITFSVIDRLFGGQGEPAKLTRDLSEIEQSVMENVIVRILSNLRESWGQVIDLRPQLSQIEANPQFAQIVPPTEMVVLVTLETRVGEVEGMINLCIPYLTIEPIISKLSAHHWYSSTMRAGTIENFNVLSETIANIEVPLTAEIGTTFIPMKEILALKSGDVIRLDDISPKDEIEFKVGDKTKFLCRPGIVGNKIAVQIVRKTEEITDTQVDNISPNDVK